MKVFFKELPQDEKDLLRFFRDRSENCKYFAMYESESECAKALRQKEVFVIFSGTQEINPDSGSNIGLTYCVRDSAKVYLIKHPHLLNDK